MMLGGVDPVNNQGSPIQIGATDLISLEARVKKIEDMHKYAKIVLIALVVLYLLNKTNK